MQLHVRAPLEQALAGHGCAACAAAAAALRSTGLASLALALMHAEEAGVAVAAAHGAQLMAEVPSV